MIKNLKKIDWMKVVEVTMLVGLMFSVSVLSSYADPINPGVKASQWVQVNVSAIFGAAVGILGIVFLFTRKILKGIGFLIVAALAALMIYNGVDFAKILSDLIMSFFKK